MVNPVGIVEVATVGVVVVFGLRFIVKSATRSKIRADIASFENKKRP